MNIYIDILREVMRDYVKVMRSCVKLCENFSLSLSDAVDLASDGSTDSWLGGEEKWRLNFIGRSVRFDVRSNVKYSFTFRNYYNVPCNYMFPCNF